MRSAILTLLPVFLITLTTLAQGDKQNERQEKIEQLKFMQGTWQGPGWIMKSRERKEFIQKEVIEPRIDNKILVIDGIGYDKESPNS